MQEGWRIHLLMDLYADKVSGKAPFHFYAISCIAGCNISLLNHLLFLSGLAPCWTLYGFQAGVWLHPVSNWGGIITIRRDTVWRLCFKNLMGDYPSYDVLFASKERNFSYFYFLSLNSSPMRWKANCFWNSRECHVLFWDCSKEKSPLRYASPCLQLKGHSVRTLSKHFPNSQRKATSIHSE